MSAQPSSTVIGCSGMRMTSAPPAMPLMHGDPAGVAAHHLDDHDAVVRLGGRVQPVDRFGRDGDRRVEAERVVRAGEVVVDRLRHADHGEARAPRGAAPRRRACPRRRSRRARRALALEGARAPSRRRPRACRGSCATCRGSCRRAAGSPRSRGAERLDPPSTSPLQPSRTPTTSCPRSTSAASRPGSPRSGPGQSPPPVRIPTFIGLKSMRGA